LSTLLELRTRSRQRADMVNSRFISDSELNYLINASVAELYDLLIANRDENYYIDSDTFTTSAGDSEYDLPADFYKLMGVDLVNGSSDSVTLKAFKWQERNRSITGVEELRYQIRNNTLKFIPTPSSGKSIKVWYVPRPTALSLDADTFDGINGFEEYVIIDAAIKMRVKEESPVQELMLEKQMMEKRILKSCQGRDSTEPPRVIDVEGSGWN
jgi:hypothetical protein